MLIMPYNATTLAPVEGLVAKKWKCHLNHHQLMPDKTKQAPKSSFFIGGKEIVGSRNTVFRNKPPS